MTTYIYQCGRCLKAFTEPKTTFQKHGAWYKVIKRCPFCGCNTLIKTIMRDGKVQGIDLSENNQ